MKSFDEMADDFVAERAKIAIHKYAYKLTDNERTFLRLGYMDGLNAGIEFCLDTIVAREEKGL